MICEFRKFSGFLFFLKKYFRNLRVPKTSKNSMMMRIAEKSRLFDNSQKRCKTFRHVISQSASTLRKGTRREEQQAEAAVRNLGGVVLPELTGF